MLFVLFFLFFFSLMKIYSEREIFICSDYCTKLFPFFHLPNRYYFASFCYFLVLDVQTDDTLRSLTSQVNSLLLVHLLPKYGQLLEDDDPIPVR